MKYFPLATGIVSLLFGFFLLARPLATVSTLGWILALFVFVSGVNGIMDYFHQPHGKRSIWILIQHTISIVFGFALITSSSFAKINVVIMILAYWVLLSGFLRLVTAAQLRRAQFPSAEVSYFFLAGIFAVIFGFLLLSAPVFFSALIGNFIAFVLIFIGISSLAIFFRIR
ncbi:HdeD family acid-resistance protein [Streptococcus sp. zg-JUN1979]|uniref:HdeD family acid-resistance protein n=1 Tax=Streptococcus sp. zg-JUN1979 TaxID=3391450 RepID=UPI0039A743E7